MSSPNYIITFESGRLTVGKASTMVSATTTPNPSRPMQAVELRAIVSVLAPGAGAPSGLVEFRENGVLLGTAAVSQGVATLSYRFKHGTHAIAAVYAGDASFIGSTASVMHEAN